MKKQVVCTVEPIPNYIGHLLACACPQYDHEYSKQYRSCINQDDLPALSERSGLLAWGSGSGGPLSNFFVFYPAYLSPSDEHDLFRYLHAVERSFKEQTFGPLIESFPVLLQQQNWTSDIDRDVFLPPAAVENAGDVPVIADVFRRNFGRFVTTVWPELRERLLERAYEVNRILGAHDLVGLWERITGMSFLYPLYQFVMSVGLKDGPNYNSLGYERNWVWYGTELLVEGIIHEIGTHLLIDIQKGQGPLRGRVSCFQVFETLADHYCEKVIGAIGLHRSYVRSCSAFSPDAHRIIDLIAGAQPEISPGDLFIETVRQLEAE